MRIDAPALATLALVACAHEEVPKRPDAASTASSTLPPAPPAVDARTGRLARLCRIWGEVRYQHPWIVMRGVDWDAPLEAAIGRLEAAVSDDDEDRVVERMIGALDDPATVLKPRATPRLVAGTAKPTSRWATKDTLVLDLGGEDPAATTALMKALAADLQKADALVVDLRVAPGVLPPRRLLEKTLLPVLAMHLPSREIVAPARVRVVHDGYRPHPGTTSGGYSTAVHTDLPERWPAARGHRPTRIVFVANRDAPIPDLAMAVQRAGDAHIVADGAISDAGTIELYEVARGDRRPLLVRVTDLDHPLRADVTIAAPPDTKSDPALDAALALAQKPAPKAAPALVSLDHGLVQRWQTRINAAGSRLRRTEVPLSAQPGTRDIPNLRDISANSSSGMDPAYASPGHSMRTLFSIAAGCTVAFVYVQGCGTTVYEQNVGGSPVSGSTGANRVTSTGGATPSTAVATASTGGSTPSTVATTSSSGCWTPPDGGCGYVNEPCCEAGAGCGSGLDCNDAGACEPAPLCSTVKTCLGNSDCGGGPCFSMGGASACTSECFTNCDCPYGSTCKPLFNVLGGNFCMTTTPIPFEICNGKDDNCNGIIDDEPAVDQWCAGTQGPGYVCQNGACVCPHMCGGQCADLTSVANCGSCGNTCATGQFCVGGSCVCSAGEALCNGACTVIDFDVMNCGACGHVCPGGASASCTEGHCLLTLVSSGNWVAGGIAVDGVNVYWTTQGQGTVMKCAVGGCNNNPTTIASGQADPTGIAVDATSVYWTNAVGGTVMKCPISGCNGNPQVLVSGLSGAPWAIAVDATSVYWANQYDSTIQKCPLGGGTPVVLAGSALNEIAVDGSAVYWATSTAVMACANGCSGNNPTALATGQSSPTGIATDGTSVYWATGDFIRKCASAGCGNNPTTLATLQSAADAVAVDATSVYWTVMPSAFSPLMMKCPTGGCTGMPTTIADRAPNLIALDATSLYFAGDGVVVELTPK
jgi:hypothetical protein